MLHPRARTFAPLTLEARNALLRFARRRGDGPLRLLLHAAVPQSFRPEMLTLIRVNFVPEADADAAAEADVLLSSFCEALGGGYFQLDPEIRRQCLDHLGDIYAEDSIPRDRRVTYFLLVYIERCERTAGIKRDALLRDWLDIQRWVAAAFIDPDRTAIGFAEALARSQDRGEAAVSVQLGALAATLSIPLTRYPELLCYAAGLQAIETGDQESARRLLGSLREEELRIGPVTLRSPRQRALAIREKALGPEHPAVAESLNDLADLYRDTGRSAEAALLYQRAMDQMSGSFEVEASDKRVQAAQAALRAALADWAEEDLEAFVAKGYPPYWLSFDAGTHARHARLVRQAEREDRPLTVEARIDRAAAVTEVTIYTADYPGLLSRLAGALAVSGTNIVEAKIFTLTNGMALDVFNVQDTATGAAFDVSDKLAQLSVTIGRSLSGQLKPLQELAKRRPAFPSRTRVFRVQPRVLINNNASRSYTVIEVNGRDRIR